MYPRYVPQEKENPGQSYFRSAFYHCNFETELLLFFYFLQTNQQAATLLQCLPSNLQFLENGAAARSMTTYTALFHSFLYQNVIPEYSQLWAHGYSWNSSACHCSWSTGEVDLCYTLLPICSWEALFKVKTIKVITSYPEDIILADICQNVQEKGHYALAHCLTVSKEADTQVHKVHISHLLPQIILRVVLSQFVLFWFKGVTSFWYLKRYPWEVPQ